MYGVILADPPWRFESWNDKGTGRSAEQHYQTMDHLSICAMPIQEVSNDNCALFLWAVWPMIPDALNVISEWGFEYKTVAWTWVKAKASGFGHFMGMGYYTRANTEPCLLAVRGRMPVDTHDVLALIYSPVREHSRKPDEQYGKIARLYPNAKCLELFARKKHDGWDVWGNEVESDIEMGAGDSMKGEDPCD